MSIDPVAVRAVVVEQRAVRGDAALDDEPAGPAAQHERTCGRGCPVSGPGVGDELHAERGLVELRGLGRVADDQDDGVPAGHRERVAGFVVLDQPDQLPELVEVEGGERSVGQVQYVGHEAIVRLFDKLRNAARIGSQFAQQSEVLAHNRKAS